MADRAAAVHGVRRRTSALTWGAAGLVLLAVGYPELHLTAVRVAPLLRGLSVEQMRVLIAQQGPWAVIASLSVMVANTFLPTPGESMGIVNGAVFGFWGGVAVSWTGVMSSAVLAFGIGRALRRRTVARGPVQRVLVYADALVERGWQAALVIRFIPLLPFTIFNVALGRARVGWGTFLWTTAVGVLPTTAVLAAVGCGLTTGNRTLLWAAPALVGLMVAGLALRRRMRPPSAGTA